MQDADRPGDLTRSLHSLGQDTADIRPSIDDGDVGIVITDPIEQIREVWWTTPDCDVVEEVGPDRVPAPVSNAARLDVTEMGLGRPSVCIVRDADWNGLGEVSESTAVFDDLVLLQITGRIKQYVLVDGEVTIDCTENTRLEFPGDADVHLGVRSVHSQPGTTITTTEDPRDLMAACSAFGDSLKTTSAERSWPTLRGHPPILEIGDETDIPSEIGPPVPEIRITIPENRRYIYPAVPLAYYLGARIEPGSIPKIETADGWSLEFSPDDPTDVAAYEQRVREVLQQVFFLECVSRTDGMMQIPLVERRDVEDDLEIDLDVLYSLGPVDRLKRCLSVQYDHISEYVPQWDIVAHLRDDPEHAELLPYLVNDLAIVRTRGTQSRTTLSDTQRQQLDSINELVRSDGGTLYRSSSPTDDIDAIQIQEDSNVCAVAWAGDRTPVRSTHLSQTAFKNRVARSSPSEGPIDVCVVVNDPLENAETDITHDYGTGPTTDGIPFSVNLYRNLSTNALRTQLEHQETNFFHYIGHADEDGLRCSDGRLDLGTLDQAHIDAFLLNACQSYEHGLSLIDAGAIGGIVTLRDVPDAGAGEVGRDLARLLNSGYPLRAALAIVRDHSILSGDYLVIGDGGATLARSNTAAHYYIDRVDEDTFDFRMDSYASSIGLGGFVKCHLDHPGLGYMLAGNDSEQIRVSQEDLQELFNDEQIPVRIRGRNDLFWSMDLDLDDV